MRKCFLYAAIIAAFFLTGCEAGRNVSPSYPRIEYRNSSYNMDSYNREIVVLDGYVLDEGHSYDTVETENGYDVVLHFVSLEGGNT